MPAPPLGGTATLSNPYLTGPPPPPPPTVVSRGAFRVDNAAAWAIALVPLIDWLLLVPVRLTYELTFGQYLVVLALLLSLGGLAFYPMDRSALRQAGVDMRSWCSPWFGWGWHLVERSRYAGQPWAMPVVWTAGTLLAVLL